MLTNLYYEQLIKARNFHYENFNKWMTYFYVMIGALFLGVCYIVSKSVDYLQDYQNEILAITSVGFIVSQRKTKFMDFLQII